MIAIITLIIYTVATILIFYQMAKNNKLVAENNRIQLISYFDFEITSKNNNTFVIIRNISNRVATKVSTIVLCCVKKNNEIKIFEVEKSVTDYLPPYDSVKCKKEICKGDLFQKNGKLFKSLERQNFSEQTNISDYEFYIAVGLRSNPMTRNEIYFEIFEANCIRRYYLSPTEYV